MKSFLKNNTDPIPHLHPCTCTSTWTRWTCGPKIGFNKEVEINCIKPISSLNLWLLSDNWLWFNQG